MTPDDTQRVVAFIDKWQDSEDNERANYQTFFGDLCIALGVEGPPPKGSTPGDPYCFDKDIKFFTSDKAESTRFADFYKESCFLIEAKQGSQDSSKGHGKRGTKTYRDTMQKAFNQAKSYAYNRLLGSLPPFLITCDIGSHFEIWEGFSGEYGSYGARQRVNLADLKQAEVFDRFVKIFNDPQALNPEKYRARVTREVAAELAKLSRWLEENPSPLAPLPVGEGNRNTPSDLPSPLGRRAGDEGLSTHESTPWDGEFSRLTGRWRQIPDEFVERARELRKNQTPAETLLWELLRSRRFLGAKFRRQHEIGPFIADFYCHDARLVIELDGKVHLTQGLRDQDRNNWMQANGLTVLRFSNDDVFEHTEDVLSAIAEVVSPSPLAPLPVGEGNRNTPSDLPSPLGRRAGDEGNHPQAVAQFLMRCIFTMFAEDVELLKGEVFTTMLRDRWIPHPETFKPEIEELWRIMNTGGNLFGQGRILQFNGSFFEDATAFELPKEQLETLLKAAEKDWSQVEPAIFGTLVERALEKKERSRLGAHYTPRSYVERLVRPVVMEPLRQEWDEIELELKRLLEPASGAEEPTANQRKKAEQEIRTFLDKLQTIKILDPACGTGNFLYVSLDLLKGLEAEVQTRLVDVAGQVQLNVLEQINPSQFLGIEINPRAAAIAELVIWIGYLQWYFKRYGNAEPPEPVLQAFGNIENRDAVLAYDGKEPDVDPKTGQVRTRWGGRMMTHPVTGEEVPDPTDQVVIYRYLNARAAEWPEADYVVSNPPFIGNSPMRDRLGDGYTEIIRKTYHVVPETVDYVMYWWHKCADLVRSRKLKRFGLITTNTIRQTWQRKLIELHQLSNNPIRLFFAVPDHPWSDEGAAVRIAMTGAELDNPDIAQMADLKLVINEPTASTPEDSAEKLQLDSKKAGKIFPNLCAGVDVSKALPLNSGQDLCSRGMQLIGGGFRLSEEEVKGIEPDVVHLYLNGRDLLQTSRGSYVIDLFGLSEQEAMTKFPKAYQWVSDRVRPEREQNNRKGYRENWCIFGEPRANFRPALKDLSRYITTVETAKHRIFVFLDRKIVPDNMLVNIALEDAYFLGILSSCVHVLWSLSAGGRLGVGLFRIQGGNCIMSYV
ncbi:DUF559 domain-containing protein [Nodosilinea sp. LEGE 07088]|uniref:DUF559 domain-containing protein n=1 Tax=Nodosilinea sp. LEGE 07088 TaxID=2777968 RepID=UPI00187DE586|nr:DUF559 domain-containing protein [Nodosilinea sp. LEGE 07088]MBE9138108.1 DUF559 domain-containing protein [Nodosilinea sp. LEGE 07088]